MERKQFTFYRSYYEAISCLPKEEQCAVILAVAAYALDETEPTLEGTAKAIFSLIRPTLDSGRRKAEVGKQGGSKTKANRKQTKSKKEKEVEIEIENECYISPKPPKGDDAFDVFWKAYPKKVGKGAAKKAFSKVKVPVESLVSAIERQKCSLQWSRDNGQYIPNPSTWLNQGRWDDEIPGSAMNAPLERPKPVRYRLDENGDLCIVED